MGKGFRSILLWGIFGAAFAVAQSGAPGAQPKSNDPLSIGVQSAFFGGNSTPSGIIPVIVTVENTGPGTAGAVIASNDQFITTYPVELPNGSKKSFVAYVPGGSYTAIKFELRTSRGVEQVELSASMNTAGYPVAAIDDRQGVLQFMKNIKTLVTYSVKPENAPDRTIGYQGFRGVILGEGAERLSDEQVAALRRFVTMGGNLFFRGGAGNPTLRDPRWQDLLPISSMAAQTRPIAGLPKLRGGGNITILRAERAGGAEEMIPSDAGPLLIRKPFGMGYVNFLPLDPITAPARELPGGDQLAAAVLSPALKSLGFLGAVAAQDPYASFPGGGGFSTGDPNDPFSAELPETGRVLLILGIYLILVVPVNFLILRLIKRGELAWITTPIISLAFSFIFFRLSGNLYSQGLARSTSGVIVADPLRDEAYFAGKAQMFFPRGGSYDLKSAPLDAVWSGDPNYYMRGGFGNVEARTLNAFNPVDVGIVAFPQANVSNLSFHEIRLAQTLSLRGKLTGEIKNRSFQMKNETGLKFVSGYLVSPKGTYTVKNMNRDEGLFMLDPTPIPQSMSQYINFPKGPTYFIGQVTDSPVGPQLGKYAVSEPLYFISELNP
jgi:hypothetical protein